MESYEEKYKEALERARKYMKDGGISQNTIDYLCNIFPELKESEDERIRKELIDYIKTGTYHKDWIAWLENQDKERKITYEDICKSYGIQDIGDFSDGYHTFNGLYKQRMILFAVLVKTYKDKAWKSWRHEDGENCFGGGWFIVGIDTPAGTYTYHYEAKYWDMFDCQILYRAKHWDGHDEYDVERLFSLIESQAKPRFKVGDWVVTDHKNNIVQIKAIKNDNYVLENDSKFSVYYVDKCWRKWNISDAKNGDILNSPSHKIIWIFKDREHYHTYVNMNYTAENVTINGSIVIPSDTCPATKDERTILFTNVKKAGFEWNETKKELEEIDKVAYSPYKTVVESIANMCNKYKNRLYEVEARDFLNNIAVKCSEAIEYEKKYPIWSEEDEKRLKSCLNILQPKTLVGKTETINTKWLKSLKNRIQPKQELSEEDKKIINKLMAVVELYFGISEDLNKQKCLSWLKSLKQKMGG